MPIIMQNKLTVWFDGACPLCTREIAFMQKLDRRKAINFIDVSTDTSECPIDRTTLLARFHAEENGTLFSGAAAFAAMWRAIPVLKPFGLVARNRFILGTLENCYVLFLKHRPKLQRLVSRLEKKQL
jgi:predicted DCC family thiol-disulfide oxidoreductase YuxK